MPLESRQEPLPLAHEFEQVNGDGATTRIGIFGGTFDPIHIGHLILAEEAWFQLKLDTVYMVPAGDPPTNNCANYRLLKTGSR